jgi:endo-1,4-beta-xylanase
LISIIENHIAKFNTHYKGKLYCMDVVNEPFNDDGTWRADLWWGLLISYYISITYPSGRYNAIGPGYVDIALWAAHSADPSMKLYINDYNVRELALER